MMGIPGFSRRAVLVAIGVAVVLAVVLKVAGMWNARRSPVVQLEAGFWPKRIVMSREGDKLFAAGGKLIRCWRIPSGEQVWTAPATEGVRHIDLEATGALLAVLDGQSIRLIDPISGVERRQLGPVGSWVFVLAFSPDGKTLLSAGTQATLWDVASGSVVWTSQEFSATNAAFSPDGRWIASGSSYNEVTVWNAANGSPSVKIIEPRPGVTCVCFSPDSKSVGVGPIGGAGFAIWGIDGRERWRLANDGSGPAAFSPDGSTVAVADQNSQAIWFHDARDGRAKSSVAVPHCCVTASVCFSANGRYFAATDGSGSILVWRRGGRW